jgi:ubiquinone/menaquinone biosynthesis C-methylase UbiE
MTDNFERIQKFKEQAWNTKGAARWYAIAVNDSFGIEDIDLATQLRLLESQVTPGARIADIGCGTGALSIDLASKGYEVTGFDISSFMLNELKKRAKNIPIKTVQADVFNLNSSHGLYDAAISRWVLPHFPNWGEIVLSVGKVLRTGGVFVFDVKNLEHDEFAKGLAGSNAIGPGSDESLDLVDPFYYTTKVSDAAIHSVLEDSGFELVSRTPFGLLASNVLISEGASEKELRTRRRLLNFMANRSRALRNLMEAIERNLTPYIPVHLVHRSFIVARKK